MAFVIRRSEELLVVDLSRVDHVDGSSIGALARLLRTTRPSEVEIRCGELVRRQLQIAGCPGRLVDVP